MPDAIALLTQDHEEVKTLFGQYESLGAGGTAERKREIVRQITAELMKHSGIEEQIFYPAVRAALPQGSSLAGTLIHEHQKVEQLLDELEGLSPEDPVWEQKVSTVITDVRQHIQEEESQAFPKIRETLRPEVLGQMGDQMQKAKRLAPTHPHPKAPNEPPGNLVAAPMAGAADRVRDAGPGKVVPIAVGAAAALGLVVWRVVRRRAA